LEDNLEAEENKPFKRGIEQEQRGVGAKQGEMGIREQPAMRQANLGILSKRTEESNWIWSKTHERDKSNAIWCQQRRWRWQHPE